MNYRREIDGLRALAVLPVILFHAGFEAFSGGFIGVDIFFVISGYLITSIIMSDLKQGKFSLLFFYERRARRILPALLFVIMATIPWAWALLLPHDFKSFSESLFATSVFASNIFFWSERGYFSEAAELKPLIHTWSLAVEEQFYLFFPLALALTKNSKTLRSYLLAVALSASFFLSVWVTSVHQDSAFFLLPTRLWELLVGSLVAIHLFNAKGVRKISHKRSSDFFGILGLLLILASIFSFDSSTPFPGYAALAPVTGTALVTIFANDTNLVGRFLGARIFVAIGLVSYSAYLWHQPIFALSRHGGIELTTAMSASLIALTFVASYFSWRYVEQPFRRRRFSQMTVFRSALLGLAFIAAVGVSGYKSEGFPNRFPQEDIGIFENLADAGSYVALRFDALNLSAFDLNDLTRKKVVLIGDSYGKDLINAIYESDLDRHFQFTTHQINAECGNLYLDEDFSDEIDSKRYPRCRLMGWYDNEALTQRIAQADYIWLASAWSMWVAEKLPVSIANLEREFDKPVLIFGTKNFGEVNARFLLDVSFEQRSSATGEISSSSYEIQSYMRGVLRDFRFVDIGRLICGDDERRCRLFNTAGEPLSFDGGHLTRAGAKFLGEALIESNALSP